MYKVPICIEVNYLIIYLIYVYLMVMNHEIIIFTPILVVFIGFIIFTPIFALLIGFIVKRTLKKRKRSAKTIYKLIDDLEKKYIY